MAVRLTLLILLCACAAPIVQRDKRRVPRGWTIDTSNQDLRAANVREEKAFGEGKIIEADNLSGEGLTSEATLVSGDSREQLEQLIKDFNQLLCVNNALDKAILAAEDRRCFARVRTPKVLEVHVSTAIGALRDDERWPKFTVKLGGKDGVDFREAYAPDGGTVVFRKKLATNEDNKRIYNMVELVNQIGLSLRTEKNKETHFFNDYKVFEDPFGDDMCLSRHLGGIGTCKKGKKANLKDRVIMEKNKLIITRIEIYLRFDGDKNLYKIFSARSSRDKPVTILDNSNYTHTVTGFENNPHWLLHYHSSNCNAWSNPNHDGTEFGKYIWNNYINSNSASAVDIFRSPLHCPGSSAVPVSIHPDFPELGSNLEESDVGTWLAAHEDQFKPHPNNSKAECQPRTAQTIRDEALQDKPWSEERCGKDVPDQLAQPADLDKWDAERLDNKIKFMQDENAKYERSINSFITRLNWETGSGCFHEKQLSEGIQVKVHGQALVSVGGKLMTMRAANTCVFNETGSEGVSQPNDNIIFINLGLNAQSYPLILTTGNEPDGTFRFELDELQLKPSYTKKFALPDLSYVYFAKRINADFFSNKVISILEQDFWNPSKGNKLIDALTVPVEVGILAIRYVELSVSGKVIYAAGTEFPASGNTIAEAELCENEGKSVMGDALFILSNRHTAWQDYNLRGNKDWTAHRDNTDHCEVNAE